eukprot:Phypoly_transcript_17052.p1 GENE.Phypoly_transcript_17052~~Phypoly_transcript_17052.p1  ORF type:complete len:264 (+),score=47.30 Phypoly_transcript_17052:28-819(+)
MDIQPFQQLQLVEICKHLDIPSLGSLCNTSSYFHKEISSNPVIWKSQLTLLGSKSHYNEEEENARNSLPKNRNYTFLCMRLHSKLSPCVFLHHSSKYWHLTHTQLSPCAPVHAHALISRSLAKKDKKFWKEIQLDKIYLFNEPAQHVFGLNRRGTLLLASMSPLSTAPTPASLLGNFVACVNTKYGQACLEKFQDGNLAIGWLRQKVAEWRLTLNAQVPKKRRKNHFDRTENEDKDEEDDDEDDEDDEEVLEGVFEDFFVDFL